MDQQSSGYGREDLTAQEVAARKAAAELRQSLDADLATTVQGVEWQRATMLDQLAQVQIIRLLRQIAYQLDNGRKGG